MNFFFYNSAAYEPWSFETPDKTGIGNSETAQVEMTWRLAARGHDIKSFCVLDGVSRTNREVEWLSVDDAEKFLELPGIWVVSRSPYFLDKLPPMDGRQVWFVSQDVEYGDILTKERLSRIDRMLALCPVHGEYLAERYPEIKRKIYISSNAARVDLIERTSEQERNPFRLVYTSSPDRGLLSLLSIFKRAREFEPQLELSICYGFDNLKKHADKIRLKYIGDIERQLNQPGVINKGRLPQTELYKLLKSCGLWTYPTSFQETGCASHLEAMCCGAVPVFSPLWAMEHNGGYGWAIPGNADDSITRARFVRAILRLVWEPQLQEQIRSQMMPWAKKNFNWENVVNHYEGMI